ncbi:MAG: septum formation protein Maf [Anaerolineae bacterium]|nr:septum formation protein Maf [Anaerolineae bacterium]
MTESNPTTPRFILASSSPRRRELLASLNIPFAVIKPDVDETQHQGEPPLDYVERLSQEKAQAVAEQIAAPALVLAADTIVLLAADTIGIFDDEILGKPANENDARSMLRRLRGRAHTVCTALTLRHMNGTQSARTLTRITQTTVYMRDYSEAEIDAYIATGDPFDKAGSYAIQHQGFHPVARIEGSQTNVVGLPIETLNAMLVEIGFPGVL